MSKASTTERGSEMGGTSGTGGDGRGERGGAGRGRLDRRGLLRGAAALGGVALAAGGYLAVRRLTTGGDGSAGAAAPARRPWYELGITGDPIMDNQLLWYLSATWQRMADVGECLETGSRIRGGDDASWFREWLRTAERVRAVGDTSAAGGHRLSAGDAYLRAANYYRAALIHYARPEDPELLRATRLSVQCYDRARQLLGLGGEAVRIPYEGTTLPGYLYRSPLATGRAPLLIVHEGLHAWPEETLYLAEGATQRGYHCLQFHGPGQGLPLREEGLIFRPDWERVVTPAVDFALALPGVDPDRLALMGISFGGALAPRAAAFERRLSVLIANPGVLNWGAAIRALLAEVPGVAELLKLSPQLFDVAVREATRQIPSGDWWWRDAGWKYGARTPSELLAKLEAYDNTAVAGQITCKVLVMDSAAEAFTVGQAQQLYDALRGPKEYMLFTAEEAGEVHSQTGALALSTQRTFDWLDANL